MFNQKQITTEYTTLLAVHSICVNKLDYRLPCVVDKHWFF